MRALLDTSCFLWFIAGSDNLSINARNFIVDINNELVLSISSLWEIVIKVSIGRLELLRPFEQLIPEQLNENEIDILPIELSHLSTVMELPFHHRDPFDRLIIAQGITERLPVISNDNVFHEYPIEIIW
ncbi:MAG: type II toxin-antitoxin system VapC family toxin [bacterium]